MRMHQLGASVLRAFQLAKLLPAPSLLDQVVFMAFFTLAYLFVVALLRGIGPGVRVPGCPSTCPKLVNRC